MTTKTWNRRSRAAVVTYLLGAGDDRSRALAAGAQARADGWRATLYADEGGWVVRLCRSERIGEEQLAGDRESVERLARECGLIVRGSRVEPAPLDPWAALAARVRDEYSAGHVHP